MLKHGDKFLLTAGGKDINEIKLWNFKNGELIRTFQNEETERIYIMIKGQFNEVIVAARKKYRPDEAGIITCVQYLILIMVILYILITTPMIILMMWLN